MYIKDIKLDIINNIEFMKILRYSHYNPTKEKLNKIVRLYSENGK